MNQRQLSGAGGAGVVQAGRNVGPWHSPGTPSSGDTERHPHAPASAPPGPVPTL